MLPAATRGQERAAVAGSPFSQAPYRVGERLTYTVSFSNFQTAAHVETSVTGRGQYFGREGIELRARVETLGVVHAALYSVNNEYVTYVDPATGLPYRTQSRIREGARIEDAAADYNVPVGTSALPPRQTAGGLPWTYDLLSAIYRVRALPLTQGSTYSLSVQHQGAAVYDADVRVMGRELVKTNIGSSSTIVTRLRSPGIPATGRDVATIYFTDDERHVPVLLVLHHRAGEIRAELASAEITMPPAGVEQATPAQPGIPLRPQPGGVSTQAGGAVPGRGTAPAPGTAAPTLPSLPFEVGEELNFNFFIGNGAQPIGTASFRVASRGRFFSREGLLLTSIMQTTGTGAQLFPVNDQISSYVDPATLLPFRTELNLNEGTRRARWVVSYDQNAGSALFDDGTRVETPVAKHDLLSVFYALRSFDLTVGKRNAVSLLLNKRPRLLFVTALRSGNLTMAGRSIPATELSLLTDDPAQGDRLALRLWVSNDRRRIPLRLTAVTPLGPIRADLAIIPTSLQ